MATMLKTSGNVEHVGFWDTFDNGATGVGQRPGQGGETGGEIVLSGRGGRMETRLDIGLGRK